MLNPRVGAGVEVENLGGSIRVNAPLPVFLLFKMPIRFLVGDRPAGADKGVLLIVVVCNLGVGDRIGRVGERIGLFIMLVSHEGAEGGAALKK